jgi:hypothetical protein
MLRSSGLALLQTVCKSQNALDGCHMDHARMLVERQPGHRSIIYYRDDFQAGISELAEISVMV